MSDLDELKRLAQAATDIADGKLWLMRIRQMFATGYDERFIIATTPAAVLALIERVAKAEAQREETLRMWREYKDAKDADVEALKQEVARLDEHRALMADRARNAERDAKFNEARAAERNNFAQKLVQAESERDAYKERVALLEGWSKATAAALTGEEAAELRPAWTCEKAREVRARNTALEAFTAQFAETVEHDLANEEAHGKGGMQVTLTGDFVRLPPFAKSRLRWWAKRAKEALEEGR